MDAYLPQMASLDFDRLDPIALKETLAYFREHPEPRPEDVGVFSYVDMVDVAVAERDWLGGAGVPREMGGETG
jgi:hypothetical protein